MQGGENMNMKTWESFILVWRQSMVDKLQGVEFHLDGENPLRWELWGLDFSLKFHGLWIYFLSFFNLPLIWKANHYSSKKKNLEYIKNKSLFILQFIIINIWMNVLSGF